MKLYTEEQVMKAIRETRYYSDLIKPDNVILKELTQIELPSDEEIERISKEEILYNDSKRAWWVEGAKWMKEQILNQNQ